MIATDRLLFQRQIYNFLRTLTVKYAVIADYINADLQSRGIAVNYADPSSWKYYRNLIGEYHTSDTPMYVTSVDTQERILFSKENLVLHPRTRSVYVPGGQYYSRLCAIYPKQVDLIKSILFPVEDVTKALDAKDLTILSFGSGYLEDYEEDPLVSGLKQFLEIIKERYHFEFLDDEPYFHISFLSALWGKMAAFLLVERESYIHTSYVHSWHIWNQLRDAGLDDYSDILDRKKSMMLYQNIDYLKANAGKMSNLIILANRLLDDFGVSIYSRRVIQETETGAAKYQLTPQLQAVRIPTNTSASTSEITNETVEAIQARAFAKGFAIDSSSESAVAKERQLGDTTLNDFMTKFLEIRPIARNKVYADTLNIFLMETLVTSIIHDHYTQPVLVNDPATGSVLYLYPKELLALYNYATLKEIGITPENIPNHFYFYRSFTRAIGTPAKTIPYRDEKIYVSMHVDAQSYLSNLAYNENIEEPVDFSDMVTRQWMQYMYHVLEDTDTTIDAKRYTLEYLSSLCHSRRVETSALIEGHTSYETWFGPEGIDIRNTILSQYDLQTDPSLGWGNLADAIISAMIPMNDTLNFFGNFTLTDFGYERLRQLFIQMCSYKVVFLESSRTTPNFTTGGKWSTRHGPDSFDTYSDSITVRNMHLSDDFTSNVKMTLNPGFCDTKSTDMVMVDTHVDGINVVVKSTKKTEAGELIRYVPQSKVSAQYDVGHWTLFYGGMVVDKIGDEVIDSYLIDDDDSPIMDSDGQFIVDPD